MESSVVTFAVGLLAQIFFSARILIQWIMSEKAHRSLSPSMFWVFSLAGAFTMCIYGCLRSDFSIVLGQFIAYYIYIWNLNMKGVWTRMPKIIRGLLTVIPIVAAILLLSDVHDFIDRFIKNDGVPMWLLIYGSAGQILFVCRFIYQWLYSRRRGESMLPTGFWLISLTGSLCIVSYGIIRLDPVLILGQSFGLVSYIRNLVIIYRQHGNSAPKDN